MEIKFLNEKVKNLNESGFDDNVINGVLSGLEDNLSEDEMELIKIKKRHIKVLGTAALGILGMKTAKALEISKALESGFIFLTKGSFSFMGALPIPNYAFLIIIILALEGVMVKAAASRHPENIKEKGKK